MSFDNKVVLITGASSGIGAECALAFAKYSATLVLVARNMENLEKVAHQCEKLTRNKPLLISADITIEKDLDMVIDKTLNEYSKIDVLINNAGINAISVAHDMSAFDRVMATNIRGTYQLTSKVVPHLIKTRGNIVNMSSILSQKPLPIMTPYCMSKAALDMFTKCTALQLGSKGVRVNSVNPGPLKTELFKRGGMSDEHTAKMFAQIEINTTLKKITKGEDVAELVAFLASDRASCISGSCNVIDCGLMLGEAGDL